MGNGLFGSYTNAPLWRNGIEFSPTSYTILRDNLAALDLVSQRPRTLVQANVGGIDSARPEQIDQNPQELWNGGFLYRVGMTTLTIALDTTLTLDGFLEWFRVVLNGVVIQDTFLTGGAQSIAVPINGLGYADLTVIEVQFQLFTPDYEGPLPDGVDYGRVHVLDAYVSPLSANMPFAWPGVPTFGDLTEARLNQLSNASDWLAIRLGRIPEILFQSVVLETGLFFLRDDGITPTENAVLQVGGSRGPFDRLRVPIYYEIIENVAESLQLRINNAPVATIGPFGPGTRAYHTFTIDVSGYSASAPLKVELVSIVAVANVRQPSRYSIYDALFTQSAPTAIALPAATPMREQPRPSINTLQSRLNSLATGMTTLKARLDASSDRYDRGRLFRMNYGDDERERAFFFHRYITRREARAGARLLVRGKNVKIEWGTVTTVPPEEEGGIYTYERSLSQTLLSGDTVATQELVLDGFEGLSLGESYVLSGDVRFAAEYLR